LGPEWKLVGLITKGELDPGGVKRIGLSLTLFVWKESARYRKTITGAGERSHKTLKGEGRLSEVLGDCMEREHKELEDYKGAGERFHDTIKGGGRLSEVLGDCLEKECKVLEDYNRSRREVS
jgi:hypothetical protein